MPVLIKRYVMPEQECPDIIEDVCVCVFQNDFSGTASVSGGKEGK